MAVKIKVERNVIHVCKIEHGSYVFMNMFNEAVAERKAAELAEVLDAVQTGKYEWETKNG